MAKGRLINELEFVQVGLRCSSRMHNVPIRLTHQTEIFYFGECCVVLCGFVFERSSHGDEALSRQVMQMEQAGKWSFEFPCCAFPLNG